MYALLALGFTLVYGILELINFSHFNVFMIGGFVPCGRCRCSAFPVRT
jgi:branched-chain amino acid transport system permease protein